TAPVNTSSYLKIDPSSIELIPRYIYERGIGNIPALLNNYITNIIGKDNAFKFDDVLENQVAQTNQIVRTVRNTDEFLLGVQQILNANQSWSENYPRLAENQRLLLIQIGENIIKRDRVLTSAEI